MSQQKETVGNDNRIWDRAALASHDTLGKLGRWLYGTTFFKRHTSWRPVFSYEEERSGVPIKQRPTVGIYIPFGIKDNRGNITNYPALKNPAVLSRYNRSFPTVLISLEDPDKSASGEERIKVTLGGSARTHAKSGGGVVWRMWNPGEEIIVTDSNNNSRRIPNVEATAADIVEHFIRSVQENTNGKIVLNEGNIYEAFRMMSERSEALNQRWEILAGRLEFQRHLLEFPEIVAIITNSMVRSDSDAFEEFVAQLRDGKIRHWTEYLSAIDKLPNLLTTGQGAILPALLTAGLQLKPEKNIGQQLSQLPASLLVGTAGIRFFNQILNGYRAEIVPQIAVSAQAVVSQQVESIRYVNQYLQLKVDAWRRAQADLKRNRPELLKTIDAQIMEIMQSLGEEIQDNLRSKIEIHHGGYTAPNRQGGMPAQHRPPEDEEEVLHDIDLDDLNDDEDRDRFRLGNRRLRPSPPPHGSIPPNGKRKRGKNPRGGGHTPF